jgi:hypothetical protein
MSVTATKPTRVRDILNASKEGQMDDAFLKAQMGNMLCPFKFTVTGLVAATTIDITTAAVAAAAVPGPFTPALTTPDDITRLPAALGPGSMAVRVTAGAAAAGARLMTDAGGTASATVAVLSDDGKSITFEATVSAFVIYYVPRSATDLLALFAAD